jgi:polysaccharide biosynthesis/export protein
MKALGISLAALFLVTVFGAPLSAQQARSTGSYVIGIGDVLDVVIWRNKELSMSVTVRPDGWISYPIAGELRAEGLTPSELQVRLQKGLAEFVASPTITVVVSRVAGFKVSILGKVRQPGRYDAEEFTTVMDVLALAGGPNEYADPDQMYVLRRSHPETPAYVRIPVRYSASVQPGKDNPNINVRSGDLIIVP